MSKLNPRHDPYNISRPLPGEIDKSNDITEKQINYIQILANDLGMTQASRNAHITGIIGTANWRNDIYALTKIQGSLIIAKFKEWKENENAGQSQPGLVSYPKRSGK